MRLSNAVLIVVLLSLVALTSRAESIISARSSQAFPEAMLVLQESIREHGYTVSRVQRIDIGLTGMGYKTDKYRVVFFGKLTEVQRLKDRYPELIPYLPPKISIFAEGEETLLIASNPSIMKQFLSNPTSEDLYLLDHWESDVRSILQDVVRSTED